MEAIWARRRLCSFAYCFLFYMWSIKSNVNSNIHFQRTYSPSFFYYSSSQGSFYFNCSLGCSLFFFYGNTISNWVFLGLFLGRQLTQCRKSRRTAPLKYLAFKEAGFSSQKPGCMLQYSRQLSRTLSMRSLLDHPILVYFLQILGRLSKNRESSSMIQSGKVRLSFLIQSLLQMITSVKEGVEMDKEQILKQRFQLIRQLGQGSFGSVYLIRNMKTRKQYALKRYNRNHLEKKGKYPSLLRSIQILQSLEHPNIIQFTNYILTSDTIYLLFEPCKKGSLDKLKIHLIQKKEIKIIKFILYQLALALCYLKDKDMAHRDLKPSNITFNSQGQLKIIDFDEAVSFDPQFKNIKPSKMLEDFGIDLQQLMNLFNSRKSRASNYVGTELYMSPEMVHSIMCDQKGDLWAYGCIVYELLTGEYLHIEYDCKQSFKETLSKRLQKLNKIDFPQQIREQAYQLLRQILKFNPKERIPVQRVLDHQFFNQLKKPGFTQQCRQRTKSFLRGNYGIQSKKLLNAFEVQLIGVKIGRQIFQILRTVVLLRIGIRYEFMNLFGGPLYFKFQYFRSLDNKFYIRYDSVVKIELKSQFIIILCSIEQKEQAYEIKHLYPQQLQNLYLLLTSIIND